jgi:hypothetical protein
MSFAIAKWVIHAAVALNPTADADWPLMRAEILTPEVFEALEVDGQPAPEAVCSAFMTICTIPWLDAPGHWTQRFCVDSAGVYTANLRFRLSTNEERVAGKVWLIRLDPFYPASSRDAIELTDFEVSAGTPSFRSASAAVVTNRAACYALRYESSGTVWLDADRRSNILTIHRSGD